MDEYQYLIEIRRDGIWKDKTAEIASFKRDENCVWVQYVNGTKRYPTSYADFRLESPPERVSFEIVCLDGFPLNHVAAVLKFEERYKIFYAGGKKGLYSANRISLERDILRHNGRALNIMNYFRKLVEEIKQKSPEDPIIFPFEQLNEVSDQSVLANYLQGRETVLQAEQAQPLIFPFGVNLSQKLAVKKALDCRISVIQGPPGTGKTQTVLNLIANLVLRGKSVAIVSTNNSAVKNVGEKLEKYGFGDIVANLGNSRKREEFFAKPKPKGKYRALERDELKTCRESIAYYSERLELLFREDNERSKLLQYLSELKGEYQELLRQNEGRQSAEQIKLFSKHSDSQKIMRFIATYQEGLLGRETFFNRLRWRLKFGFCGSAIMGDREQFLFLLYESYYVKKISETAFRIEEIRKHLMADDFEGAAQNYRECSEKLLRDCLSKRKDCALAFDNLNFRRYFKEFTGRFPVVLSTTYSLQECRPNGYLFDYVIADESSQINLLTAAVSMSCGRNFVASGDSMQLSQINPQGIAPEFNESLKRQLGIAENYDIFKHNLLTSLTSLFPNLPQTLLKEHYRCHPKIIEFCNREFYRGELIVKTVEKQEDSPLSMIVTVPGNHARGSKSICNVREQEEIGRILSERKLSGSIGLISPYREQAERLEQRFGGAAVEASTIHRFQGREKDHIIFSATANELTSFVDARELVNVAVSRAISSFCLVVSDGIAKCGEGTIGNLIRYIRFYDRASCSEGKVRSVFDLLYSDYAEALHALKEKVSAYDSENLIYHLLQDIFREFDVTSLKALMHVKLNQLISNYENFSEEEIRYLKHEWTHVDFVIINIMDKSPQLLIEVDGVRYHEQNPRQSQHDRLKDRACAQNELPLLRLKTNGSGEREKIIEMLKLRKRSEDPVPENPALLDLNQVVH